MQNINSYVDNRLKIQNHYCCYHGELLFGAKSWFISYFPFHAVFDFPVPFAALCIRKTKEAASSILG